MGKQPNWFLGGILVAVLTVCAATSYYYWTLAKKNEAELEQRNRLQACLGDAVGASVRRWDKRCAELNKPSGCELPNEGAAANWSDLERDRGDCYRGYPVPGIPNR